MTTDVRYPYGSAGFRTVSMADELEALANFAATQERRDAWRHAAGLDSNGHGVITHEPEGRL